MFEAVGVMGIEAVGAEAPTDGVQRPAACRARAMDEEAVTQRSLDKGAARLLTDVAQLRLHLLRRDGLHVVIATDKERRATEGARVVPVSVRRKRVRAFGKALRTVLSPVYAQDVPISVGAASHKAAYEMPQMLPVAGQQSQQSMEVVGHGFGGYYLHLRMKTGDGLPDRHHLTAQLRVFASGSVRSVVGSVRTSRYEAEDGSVIAGVESDEEITLVVVCGGVSLQGGRQSSVLLSYLRQLFGSKRHVA